MDAAERRAGLSFGERARGYAVHVYTASGVVLAFLAAAEICSPTPDPRVVFLLFGAATLVDATDGPLARRWRVKETAPQIDGRTIDDIVDFLTFTFLPLLLVWRMGWVPQPGAAWLAPALLASILGFANKEAKDEEGGFFRGFPSYWNVAAFYAGFMTPTANAVMFLALAAMTVAPVWFIYPNLAPRPWKMPLLAGAFLWLALMVYMVAADYPDAPRWLIAVSLIYPVIYTLASIHLARRRGR
jgi:phosphatidylcholine synthase